MLHPTDIMPSLHTLDLTIPTQLGVSGECNPTPHPPLLYVSTTNATEKRGIDRCDWIDRCD